MVNDLFDGVSIALNQVFGSDYEIYGDKDVTQGLTEPCFLIAVVSVGRTRRVANRFHSVHTFDIHYYPADKGNNVEMQSVADLLLEALEFITLLNGDMVLGTEMRFEIVEGILHFFVDYNLFLKQVIDEEEMETLAVETGTVN